MPPPTPADFTTVEEFQVQHTRLECLSILDIINKAINVRCETGLFKGYPSPYDEFPEHVPLSRSLLLEGTHLHQSSEVLHPLVKKEMLQLVNVPTCWKRYVSE